MKNCKQMRGEDVLHNPRINHSTTFTENEQNTLGLRGLLPPVIEQRDNQILRVREMLNRFSNPLNKYLMLDSILATDQDLFYKLLIKYTDEYMPIVYTPTVGEVCQKFSHILLHPHGAFLSYKDKGHLRELLANVPNEEVDVIVVTDGQRILGLGDLGINGMGIPCGKLALYTACAGIDPDKTLPVVLDVGTNTQEYLDDPLYLGLRQPRVTGDAYFEFVDEFVQAVRERWPHALIQFEDFGNANAFPLLAKYQTETLCFNDDIQGTASVAVAGVFTALRAKQERLADQRFLFMGAGEAATGIAELIVEAMVEEGMPREEALKHCMLFDSKGLVTSTRGDVLAHNKVPFAQPVPSTKSFLEAIRQFKPTGIIGVSAQPKVFDEAVLREMAALNERPMVCALSNPTSRAECTAEEAYQWTDGRALFASGSPFAPVEYNGQHFVPRQGNNSYVFPGLGLGAVFSKTRWMPTAMFLTASRRLAELVSAEDLAQGSLYPPLSQVREVSVQIGKAVAQYAYDNDLAQNTRPADLETEIRQFMYDPL